MFAFRGENAVGCTIIEQTDDPNKCTLHWIVNVDLKIWLPGGIFDKEMSQMMFRISIIFFNPLGMSALKFI
nr:unnamed protein product [Callosobruchus analis]